MNLNHKEKSYYSRHLILPEIGHEGQLALKKAKVAVVGAGGLGSPLLQYLGGAGVGTIGIFDPDVVSESNLHRQVLYGFGDIGQSKAIVAANKLRSANPYIKVISNQTRIDLTNAKEFLEEYDVIVDGTDNFATRYLLNDLCVSLNKPNVFAAIYRFEGQLAVFNHADASGTRGPNYRDLFPKPPPPEEAPSCTEGGVLGVLAGIMGCLQANEVIKLITGTGQLLSGKMLMVNVLDMSFRTFSVSHSPDNPLNTVSDKLSLSEDYQEVCPDMEEHQGSTISAVRLSTLLKEESDLVLIDVREDWEHQFSNIGGSNLPLGDILSWKNELLENKQIVVYCKTGRRSAQAVTFLKKNHSVLDINSLEGGLGDWKDNIDPEFSLY